jgi:hypothetical protein
LLAICRDDGIREVFSVGDAGMQKEGDALLGCP